MPTRVPAIPVLAEQLRVAMARTNRRLRREAGAGLGPTLTAALATIERHGPLTPSDLADRERVQRPTATRIASRLEAEGLIVRADDPSDRRSCLLSATGEGLEHLREVRTRKDAFLAQRLRALPTEDRAVLARAAVLLEELLEA